MEAGVRRITDTWLYDGFSTKRGDFLLHEDGSWEESRGDEDVSEVVDGKDRFFTRSLQNWHTHLPMTLNRGMGEGLDLMSWLKLSLIHI